MMILKTLLTSFLLTIFTELIVGWLWKIRNRDGWYVILLVNLITNPVLVMARIWGYYFFSPMILQWMTVFLEIVIWYLEGFLYSKKLNCCRHPYLLAITANAASYGCGLLINLINIR